MGVRKGCGVEERRGLQRKEVFAEKILCPWKLKMKLLRRRKK
jgi:hypothetical protein